MSLSKLYKLKTGKQDETTKNESSDAELTAKLKKLSITPEVAKQWMSDGCGKPC